MTTEATAAVETSVAEQTSTSINMGQPGVIPEAASDDGAGFSVEVDLQTGKRMDAPEEAESENGGGDDPNAPDPDKENPEADNEPDPEAPGADLGEFKPEEVAKWDKAFKKDGKLDVAALSAQWWARAQVSESGDPEGSLADGTYAYLESIGLPKDLVQDYEASVRNQWKANQQQVHERAGGKEALDAAVAWGREHYSELQRERFNADMASGNMEVMGDAVDLLMQRYRAANPPRQQRPGRDVTSRSSVPTVDGRGFASRDEWLDARAKAKGKAAEEAAVRRRLAATDRSKW